MMSQLKIMIGAVIALALVCAGYWVAFPQDRSAVTTPDMWSPGQGFHVGVCDGANAEGASCQCILTRAAAHKALPKASQLPDFVEDYAGEFYVTDEALEDAYFRGKLAEALENFEQQIPAQAGVRREEMQVMLRGFRWRSAKAVAGSCLPAERFETLQAYHGTGLAKPATMEKISRAYKVAQSRRALLASPETLRR